MNAYRMGELSGILTLVIIIQFQSSLNAVQFKLSSVSVASRSENMVKRVKKHEEAGSATSYRESGFRTFDPITNWYSR